MEAEPRDFPSNLPDAILHHIFCFLKDNDIPRLRVLSRKFQTLCMASPSFCFSQPHHSPNCSCTPVFNFMNRTVPQHRPHTLKINHISFSSFCKKRCHRKLHKQWINKLFQAFHVDELSLHYKLPSIFRSLSKFQSLKVLNLKMSQVSSVKLPEMKLASLEALHMESIETDDLVGEWVSQSFPSLKRLFLIEINIARVLLTKQDLKVQSSCLEDITIRCCFNFEPVRIITENLRTLSYIICGFYCDREVDEDELVVEISAPNLHSISWQGPPKRLRYDEGTFKNLHLAVISELFIIYPTDQNLFILSIKALRWVRTLHADSHMLLTPISFENLRHLEIKVQGTVRHDGVVFPFLEGTPNLETLTLTNARPSPNSDYEGSVDARTFKCALRDCRKAKLKKIKGLKKVKFIIRDLNYSMLELIWMVIKWCIDLEEMTFTYPSRHQKYMILVKHVILRASSALSIHLLPQSP